MVQGLPDAPRVHLQDAGVPVAAVGGDADLVLNEPPGRDAHGPKLHGKEGHGHLLPGGGEEVQLAEGRSRVHPLGQGDELVGGVAHGRDHHRQPMPLLPVVAMRWATLWILSRSPTEVPPYF